MGRRSLRLPFLLLFVLAAATATALTCFTAARRGLLLAGGDAPELLDPSSLNETLLRLAAADPFAAEERAQVRVLLAGDLDLSPPGLRPYRSVSLLLRGPGRLRSFGKIRLPSGREEPVKDRILAEFRRSLRRWAGDKGRSEPAVMAELVGLVKGPVDRHLGYPDTGRPYATCAVVGNSGILLNSGHGDLIDGHDLVIRLNNARVQGYQQHVGSKTSISFVNSNILHLCARREHCFCHPYGDFVPIVMYICQPVHFLDYLVCNASHRAPLLVTDARFDTLCARIVKYYSLRRFVADNRKQPAGWLKTHDERMFHYSSGMQAIMLALGICDQVSVFGFGKSATAKHHYHTNQKAELDLHDYEAEYAFYRDLVERPQVIPFLRDSAIKVPPVVFYH